MTVNEPTDGERVLYVCEEMHHLSKIYNIWLQAGAEILFHLHVNITDLLLHLTA